VGPQKHIDSSIELSYPLERVRLLEVIKRRNPMKPFLDFFKLHPEYIYAILGFLVVVLLILVVSRYTISFEFRIGPKK